MLVTSDYHYAYSLSNDDVVIKNVTSVESA